MKKHKVKYKQKKILILSILAVCCISITVSLGKYAMKKINDFYLRTKEFYFYSDKLTADGAVYEINNWSGVDSYTITVNMNSMENNLLVSSYDIAYDVTYECSSNAICQLSKDSGTIYTDTNMDSFNVILTPNTYLTTGDVVWVKVTATADSVYEKELTAEFSLVVGVEDLTYKIEDAEGNPYLSVNITNTLSYYTVREAFGTYSVGDHIDGETYLGLTETDKAKCHSALVTLEFDPEEVRLDMANNAYLNAIEVQKTLLNGYNYIRKITFAVDSVSSAKVRFYKVDTSQNYTYPSGNNTSIITVTSE